MSFRVYDPRPPLDERPGSVNFALALWTGLVAGLVVSYGAFDDPRPLHNGVVRLAALGATALVLGWAFRATSEVVERRLQLGVVASLVLHTGLAVWLSGLNLSATATPAHEALTEARRWTDEAPDLLVVARHEPSEVPAFERPIETGAASVRSPEAAAEREAPSVDDLVVAPAEAPAERPGPHTLALERPGVAPPAQAPDLGRRTRSVALAGALAPRHKAPALPSPDTLSTPSAPPSAPPTTEASREAAGLSPPAPSAPALAEAPAALAAAAAPRDAGAPEVSPAQAPRVAAGLLAEIGSRPAPLGAPAPLPPPAPRLAGPAGLAAPRATPPWSAPSADAPRPELAVEPSTWGSVPPVATPSDAPSLTLGPPRAAFEGLGAQGAAALPAPPLAASPEGALPPVQGVAVGPTATPVATPIAGAPGDAARGARPDAAVAAWAPSVASPDAPPAEGAPAAAPIVPPPGPSAGSPALTRTAPRPWSGAGAELASVAPLAGSALPGPAAAPRVETRAETDDAGDDGGLGRTPADLAGAPGPGPDRSARVAHLTPGRRDTGAPGDAPAVDGAGRRPAGAFDNRGARQRAALSGGDGRPSTKTEAAIERGLAWLVGLQRPDGSWSFAHYAALPVPADEVPAVRADAAATGLALLAYLGAGYDHYSEHYGANVGRAIDYLVATQRDSGLLFPEGGGDNPWQVTRFYSHGIATLALCEAYGMTGDRRLREPAQRALDYIARNQDPRLGGWRYTPLVNSDLSVTGWQVMALRSGELAGLRVDRRTYDNVRRFVERCREPAGGGVRFCYNPAAAADDPRTAHGREPGTVMTSVGMLTQLYLGVDRRDARLRQGADHLRDRLPLVPPGGTQTARTSTLENPLRDTYYWYYGTQVMFHMGGTHWDAWNDALHPLLIESQATDGPLAGSWDPLGPTPDKWAPYGGRLYVTTMNLLSLEVYYRHLPLYETAAK